MKRTQAQRVSFLVQLGRLVETEARAAMNLTPAEQEALTASEALALADWLGVLEVLNLISLELGQAMIREVAGGPRPAGLAALRAGAAQAATLARARRRRRGKAAPR